ncbi:MAG: HEPN domain-containing protein [Pseudomonadota bacterium]|nr:HEPN domain-containing protein [Pseudomonadota bacterium]
MNDKLLEYVQAWLYKAASDMKNAEIIMSADDESPPLDTVCFHCQQASEKYLKAYLIYQNRLFQNSHNLADIVEACMQVDPAFTLIQRKAETLTPYAVEVRYPDDFYIPTRQEAEESLTIAIEIREFILARIDIGNGVRENSK